MFDKEDRECWRKFRYIACPLNLRIKEKWREKTNRYDDLKYEELMGMSQGTCNNHNHWLGSGKELKIVWIDR